MHYFELDKKKTFFENLKKVIKERKVSLIEMYEVEDKFFETQIIDFCQKNKLELIFLKSPMFLVNRETFADYNAKTKKPFMKT